jgi:acyl-homoserine-lactone acylase
VNFYGDFRIGGMFAIICGFNDHLGWSTTNNHPDLEEVYALKVDPSKPDHYLIDGGSFSVSRKLVEVEFKNGEGSGLITKEWLFTPFGPVIDRSNGLIYVVKTADWNNYQRGEQLVAMMQANNLEEWKSAMKKRNISSSNYTYADDQGNIFYLWNASTPKLPHAFEGDTIAHVVNKTSEIWRSFQDFDRIPQLLNPKGGYLQNSNDPFHLTNLQQAISPESQPNNYPEPLLRLRSQHSLSLINNDKKFSLEEVVDLKYSMKMLAADRLKGDLVDLLQKSSDYKEVGSYLDVWDNTSAAGSQGSVLFNEWFWNYRSLVGVDSLYREPWKWDKPMNTPFGINNQDIAMKAMVMAIDTLESKYGSYKLAWGDVYRVRRGDVDVPVGGGSGTLGNFRVIYFGPEEEDGKRRVIGGDGWVFAVEFGEEIRAYSVLAYGQSNDPESPNFDDQAQLFAENKMKKIAFSEKEVKNEIVKSYKPGKE